MSKAALRRSAILKWWERGPWPCNLLCIDPGWDAGFTILSSRPQSLNLVRCEGVSVDSREVESAIEAVISLHKLNGLPIVFAYETWGAGGIMGIDQWLGLGEARGVWRREARVRCKAHGIVYREVLINMTRWRSRVIEEAGTRNAAGSFQRFTPAEWKVAAHKAANLYFMDSFIPVADAAESACLGIYAAKSDEVLARLPAGILDRYGVPMADRVPLEPLISGVKKKKRKRKSDDENTSGPAA